MPYGGKKKSTPTSSTSNVVEQLATGAISGPVSPDVASKAQTRYKEISDTQAKAQAEAVAKAAERTFIDDERWQSLLGLGYTEEDLRNKYVPESHRALVEEMGDMYWNAPIFQPKKEEEGLDQGTRSMVMQMVLAPYLRQLGSQFNDMRGGLQQTQANLMKQIDPAYQPYLQAMNNATYAAQDQSWIDAINSMAMTPLIEQRNQVLADYVNALKNQSSVGSDEEFLASLGISL